MVQISFNISIPNSLIMLLYPPNCSILTHLRSKGIHTEFWIEQISKKILLE